MNRRSFLSALLEAVAAPRVLVEALENAASAPVGATVATHFDWKYHYVSIVVDHNCPPNMLYTLSKKYADIERYMREQLEEQLWSG